MTTSSFRSVPGISAITSAEASGSSWVNAGPHVDLEHHRDLPLEEPEDPPVLLGAEDERHRGLGIALPPAAVGLDEDGAVVAPRRIDPGEDLLGGQKRRDLPAKPALRRNFARSAGEKRPRAARLEARDLVEGLLRVAVGVGLLVRLDLRGSAVRTTFPASFPFQASRSSSFSSFA